MSLIHEALEKTTHPFPQDEADLLDRDSWDSALAPAEGPRRTFLLKDVQWTLYGMVAALIFLSALYFFAVPLYNEYFNKTKFKESGEKLLNPVAPVAQIPPPAVSPPTLILTPDPVVLAMPPVLNPQSNFSLTGIARDQKEWTAIINNRLVRVGDRVSGAQVKLIKDDEVLIDYQGQAITLALHP